MDDRIEYFMEEALNETNKRKRVHFLFQAWFQALKDL